MGDAGRGSLWDLRGVMEDWDVKPQPTPNAVEIESDGQRFHN